MPDSTYSLPTIGTGGTGGFTNAVHFTVPSNAPDGTVLPLTFVTTGASTWTDVVNRVVHAPDMRLTRLDIDDFAPGGNNNGVIQAGETFDVIAYFKNYGTGAADGLNGNLFSADPDIAIVNGPVASGAATRCRDRRANPLPRHREHVNENPLTLNLTDNRAAHADRVADVARPGGRRRRRSGLHHRCQRRRGRRPPSTEPDPRRVPRLSRHRSRWPWTRATVDRLARVAYFRNTCAQPITLYYFHTTAVDSSGTRSAPVVVSTSTPIRRS